MIPKRKIIKKQYRPRKQLQIYQQPKQQGLINRLKSTDPNTIQETITILANLTSIRQQNYHPQITLILIEFLSQKDISLTFSTLHALNNICSIRPVTISQMFSCGFYKGIMELNQYSKELFKPLILLLTTICHQIPNQYKSIIQGVQSNVANPQSLKSSNSSIVLEFLAQSSYAVTDKSILNIIMQIVQNDQKIKNKSLAMKIILNSKNQENQEFILKYLFEYFEQVINGINLQKEYSLNIKSMTSQQAADENMEVQNPKIYQNEGNQVNEEYQIFIDSVEGVECILEALLQLEDDWEDEQNCDNQEQVMIQKQQMSNSFLCRVVNELFLKNPQFFQRNLNLTFQSGCLIYQLVLRVLLKIQNNSELGVKKYLCNLANISIINILKMQSQEQITSTILQISLQLILKHKMLQNPSTIIMLLQYLKIQPIWKQCWLKLLQLVSYYYNPQQFPVTKQQNLRIGTVLKKLIIQIPQLQLEEWRGQAIDTLFSVYSNENFDNNFVNIGITNILEHLYKQANKLKPNTKSRRGFINDILKDLSRFIQYKKNMIKL